MNKIIMELICDDTELIQNENLLSKEKVNSFVVALANWEIENDKNLNDCLSTVLLSQVPDRTNLEDVVSLDTCIALKSDPAGDLCKIELKVTNNQKIVRVAVVSEASVLEFFKQSGEYATTCFAEFVDEFQDHAVYFTEAQIQPPSAEASIKFTRTKNKGTTMWIYGIKLVLTEQLSESSRSIFDMDVISNYLSNSNDLKPDKMEMAKKVLESFAQNENNSLGLDMNLCFQKLATLRCTSQENNKYSNSQEIPSTNSEPISQVKNQEILDIKNYIDQKFDSVEKRLIERVELMEIRTNQKLDQLLKLLEQNAEK